jgi:ABC-type dipeptide/oligopeptide/nickel transport system permease subunit
MFGNRMAALGLIMLIISIGAALLAPILYPGNPQEIASAGGNAQPEWLMYFSEGYYLSRNLVVGNDPNFASPATLQEWSYGYNPAQSPYVSISRSTLTPSAPPSGSLQISSSSSSNLNLTVSRTFHYPYRGPPAKFVLQPLRIEAQGASPAQPILVKLFITRGTDQSYTMWSTNVTTNNAWIGPQYTLDSHVAQLHASAGLGKLNQLSLEAVVFSQVNDYVLGVSIDFAGPGTVNLTGLGLTAPGTAFGLLGSDNNGGDLFAQDLWGARISLFVGLISAFIGIGLGLLIGLIAGYKSGLVDESLMRFTDMMLVLPALPLLLVLITVLGQSVFNIILLIGFLGWMGFARVIRSQVLSLATRPFIEAAKAAGAGTGRILTTHVFPNVVSLTYVNLALSVPAAILTEAALSFLGLGAPTVISWGQIINNAETANSLHNWWWVIPPGVAIAFVSLSFVLIGYALDEIFNPKLRRRQ